jgi:acyl dehydratase
VRIAPTKTGAEVADGDKLLPLERTVTSADMVAYGGATWDWHRAHHDPVYAAQSGLPGPFVDGQMLGAFLAKQMIDTFGPRARIRRMSFRFRSMVFADQRIRCSGEVTAVTSTNDGTVVGVVQRIDCGERPVIEKATAEVVLPT